MIDPKMKIEIATLVRGIIEAESGKESVSKQSIIDQAVKEVVKIIEGRFASLNASEAARILKNQEFAELKEYKQKIDSTLQLQKEIHIKTSPQQLLLKFDDLFKKYHEFNNRITTFENKFNALISTKIVQVVSDEELYSLYKQSGLGLKHVAQEFNISHPTAHQYVHGGVKDLKIRDRLVKMFKEAAK